LLKEIVREADAYINGHRRERERGESEERANAHGFYENLKYFIFRRK